MRCFPQPSALVLLCLAAAAVLGELTVNVTAKHGGKTIKAKDAVLLKFPPSLDRLNRKHDRHHQRPAKPSYNSTSRLHRTRATSDVTYSGNWCGATQHSPSTNPITSVHSYFQVPTLSARKRVYPQYVAPWIGIDGATWGNALLQAGTTSTLSKTGVQTNFAWLEWIPDAAYTIPNFPVAAGDWMEITVAAPTATSGTIYISNLSQDYAYTISLNNGSPLGRVDADWILEDPATGSGLLPFAKFTNTWFEGCSATTTNGTQLGVNGATIWYLQDNQCIMNPYDNADFSTSSS